MSTMPLGMKLPVLTGFVDFLRATELYEKGIVKCDEKDNNFQEKQGMHNVEAPTSAIFTDKVKFESDSRLLSRTLSHLKNSKIHDGFEINIMSRNSFFNVLRPDIANVELLKDSTSNRDLIVRLVAHDIVCREEEEEIHEIVLKEETHLAVKAVPGHTEVLFTEKSTEKKKKKKCCSCCTKTIDTQAKPILVVTGPPLSKTGSVCELEDGKFSNGTNTLNTNVNSATCALSNWLDNQTQDFARESFLTRSRLQNCLSESAVAPSKQCRSTRILPRASLSVTFSPCPPSSHTGKVWLPPVKRGILKCHSTVEDTSRRQQHKSRKGIGDSPHETLHLPLVSVPGSSSVQQTKRLSVFPGMSAALARLFSRKSTSGIPK